MTNKTGKMTLERKNINLLAGFQKNVLAWLMLVPCVMSFAIFVWGRYFRECGFRCFRQKVSKRLNL